jgi:predicted 2-oxoglutarate/Fe(II)-dependent dioxygenase YbiX
MNQKLIENNYIVIPNFISSYRATELVEEFKEYCKSRNLNGDDQTPQSHSDYDYISFLELLCEKTQEVSSILEENVLPTYAYSRVYWNGSILERHTDRDACEISLTLHLNGDKPWPIYIQTPNGEERLVTLHTGDAMMYLGKIAEHWRNQYDGEYYTQVFLHYVRSRGDCSYAYFDKKKEHQKKNTDTNLTHNDANSFSINENIEEEITPTQSKSTSIVYSIKPTSSLEDFIQVFDNILPEQKCAEILKEYKNSDDWKYTRTEGNIIKYNTRNCMAIGLSLENIISKNYNIRKEIDEVLFNSIQKVIQQYTDIFSTFNISIDTGYELLRYEEGQFYTQHTDSFKEYQRSLSCSIHLNDDYEGGEFAFFDREMLIRAKPGSAVVFPSNFMYPHEIMPVTKGTRYSAITWLV